MTDRRAAIAVLPLITLCLGLAACRAGAPTTSVPDTPAPSPTAERQLKPADSEQPAAGLCEHAPGEVVSIILNADGPPSLRCARLTAAQRLLIINRTPDAVRLALAHFELEIPAGGQALLDEPVGQYLTPGVHRMIGGPEVWLVADHADPTVAAPLPTITADQSRSGPPQADTLYLSWLAARRVMFLTNRSHQRYYDAAGVEQIDPWRGVIVDAAGREEVADFRSLAPALQILASPSEIAAYSFRLASGDRLLYISTISLSGEASSPFRSRVIEFDLATGGSRPVWHFDGDAGRYPGYAGGARVGEAAGRALLLWLEPCFACEAFVPPAALVINLDTGAEAYLGAVGDVRLEPGARVVSYRGFSPSRVRCEPSPGCDLEGYRTQFDLAGAVISQPLP